MIFMLDGDHVDTEGMESFYREVSYKLIDGSFGALPSKSYLKK